MQKVKSIKFEGILNLLKSALIGIVITLLGTVIFAVVLKFVNLSSNLIAYINNIIKLLAIFIVVICLKKQSNEKLLLRAIIAGVVYSIFSFVIFSILNGGFVFNSSVIYDFLFLIIVSTVVTVIINILSNRNS